MKRIRGGAGLGDALYVRPIAEHFVRAGQTVVVCSDYPGVFLGSGAAVEPFRRDRIDVLAHYTAGKNNPATTQWADVRASAKVGELPLRFAWTVQNEWLIDDLQESADGRAIVVVHGGRVPMGRADGFGAELMPERAPFDQIIPALAGCFLIRVGKGATLYNFPVDSDMSDKTSVADLIDIASVCSGVIAQCSYAVPLAEVFAKPLLAVWSARGLASREPYIKTITPGKILSAPTSSHVVDDWPGTRIHEAARVFRGLLQQRATA